MLQLEGDACKYVETHASTFIGNGMEHFDHVEGCNTNCVRAFVWRLLAAKAGWFSFNTVS